jgi:hypothetical protein
MSSGGLDFNMETITTGGWLDKLILAVSVLAFGYILYWIISLFIGGKKPVTTAATTTTTGTTRPAEEPEPEDEDIIGNIDIKLSKEAIILIVTVVFLLLFIGLFFVVKTIQNNKASRQRRVVKRY